MLTATPHKGDPENFTLFLQLLDQDVYADVRSIREAMERRRAPFYLRRTKAVSYTHLDVYKRQCSIRQRFNTDMSKWALCAIATLFRK